MQAIRCCFIYILLIFVILSCSESKESETLNILFIGNSYTFYNSSPELVKALIQERFPNREVRVKLVSKAGITLERHWKGNKALRVIRTGHWDYVILQEQSKLGMGVKIDNRTYIGQTDLFFEYARKFDAEIKKVGAKTVFFMTWSRRGHPDEQEILSHAYTTIAKERDALLAPVGLVWDKLRANNQLDLYTMDGSHPSALGSYLVATTIFATLLEEQPLGLSGKITGKRLSRVGKSSLKKHPLVDISKADAEVIQRASWAVVGPMLSMENSRDLQKSRQKQSILVLNQKENMD